LKMAEKYKRYEEAVKQALRVTEKGKGSRKAFIFGREGEGFEVSLQEATNAGVHPDHAEDFISEVGSWDADDEYHTKDENDDEYLWNDDGDMIHLVDYIEDGVAEIEPELDLDTLSKIEDIEESMEK